MKPIKKSINHVFPITTFYHEEDMHEVYTYLEMYRRIICESVYCELELEWCHYCFRAKSIVVNM